MRRLIVALLATLGSVLVTTAVTTTPVSAASGCAIQGTSSIFWTDGQWHINSTKAWCSDLNDNHTEWMRNVLVCDNGPGSSDSGPLYGAKRYDLNDGASNDGSATYNFSSATCVGTGYAIIKSAYLQFGTG